MRKRAYLALVGSTVLLVASSILLVGELKERKVVIENFVKYSERLEPSLEKMSDNIKYVVDMTGEPISNLNNKDVVYNTLYNSKTFIVHEVTTSSSTKSIGTYMPNIVSTEEEYHKSYPFYKVNAVLEFDDWEKTAEELKGSNLNITSLNFDLKTKIATIEIKLLSEGVLSLVK